jgi:hypothetical protein
MSQTSILLIGCRWKLFQISENYTRRLVKDFQLEVTLSKSKIVKEIFYLDYNVNSFGGTKQVILTTTSPLGREALLGWILIGGAIFSFLLVLFLISAKGYSKLYNQQNVDNFEFIEW